MFPGEVEGYIGELQNPWAQHWAGAGLCVHTVLSGSTENYR